MKSANTKLQYLGVLILFAASAFLFSFSPMPGGDFFELKVNNKTLIQHYVHFDKEIKTLDLTPYENETLNVHYSECGKIGTKRSVSLRNGDTILKSWTFEDVAEGVKFPAMPCRVKDILEVKKNNPGKLSLVYASKEHPKGQILAVLGSADVKASLK
jgi:hypothetical protein